MRKQLAGLAAVLVVTGVWQMHSRPLATGVLAAPQTTPSVQDANDRFVKEWTDRIGDRGKEPASQVFKNVQLENLKAVPAATFLVIMNIGYARALGVPCTHCHVADDFASDAQRPKNAAREMAIMHHDINQQLSRMKYLSDPPDGRSINCTLCHRGNINPNKPAR